MKKRIYLNFLGLLLPTVLVLSALACVIFSSAAKEREIASIRDRAALIADLLNQGVRGAYTDYISSGDTARITIIAPGGRVLLDNKTLAENLENHGGREEVMDAFRTGSGKATRHSSTVGETTYYYAVKLRDGNVLRVSKTMNSIASAFVSILPAVAAVTALILLAANFAARRLTSHIVKPLEHIDFEEGNTAVYDELVPYVRKIERQKQEIAKQIAALKSRTETTLAITGNMREGLILTDRSGTVLYANKSALDVFSETDMAGKSILEVCRDIAFQQGVSRCLLGENTEIVFPRGGRIYNVYYSPVHSGEEISGVVVLFFDVTERQAAEKQRREFSANVSHELKTPLTSISALSEMIGNGMAKDGDVKAFAGKISAQARRLINIIEDIIRLAEFDEDKIGREYSNFDLHELAQSVVESLAEKAEGKRVTVSVCGERPFVTANRQMLDELLYNLIDNALKYNKEDGSVTVTLLKQNDFCKIEVADTGIGIPEPHQSRVFERFYRVDGSRSKKTGGTGLGLSIVKHIAEHHGGRVELTSTEGKGTAIVCYIAER